MISTSELLLTLVVAFLVLSPQQLSALMYALGRYWRQWQQYQETLHKECDNLLRHEQLKENTAKAEAADRSYPNAR